MKEILCFGDSNTYGYIPGSGNRYAADVRWTGVLQSLLGDGFKVIEEGCNNRTCFSDNPEGKFFTGYKIFPELLSSNIDCVILAIGTNDLQKFYRPALSDIAVGMEYLITQAKKKSCSDIIVASPSNITDDVLKSNFSVMFDEVSVQQSVCLAQVCKELAEKHGCYYLDLNEVAEVSDIDGLHYTPESHKKIAYAFFELLNALYLK